jgi:type II secretory pathway component HofQ
MKVTNFNDITHHHLSVTAVHIDLVMQPVSNSILFFGAISRATLVSFFSQTENSTPQHNSPLSSPQAKTVHQIAGELRRAHEIRAEREAAAAELRSAEEIRAERAAKQANEHTTAGPSTQQSKEGSCEGSKDGSCELGPEHAVVTPTRVEVRIYFGY